MKLCFFAPIIMINTDKATMIGCCDLIVTGMPGISYIFHRH